MKLISSLIIASLLLSSCVSQTLPKEDKAKITSDAMLYEVQSEFVIVANQVNDYAQKPFCTKKVLTKCAKPEIVIKATDYVNKGNVILQVAKITKSDSLETTTKIKDIILQITTLLK